MEEELEEQEEDIWIKTCHFAHHLSNFEITNSFNYIPRFNGVFSKNDLPGMKDGMYVINLDDLHFIGIEYIPQEILNKIKDKSITHNIFRIQENESLMCGFYCIAFIEYMLAGKTLLDYTNLFSPNNYKKNDKIIYKYFKDKYVKS